MLLAVAQFTPEMLEECSRYSTGLRVVLDPGGRTARRFNCAWTPRAFALDERGRVTYAQPAATPDPLAPLELERLWKKVG